MKKWSAIVLCLLFFSKQAFPSNVQISNISVTYPNISFTIQWDNSWNTTNNINPLYPNNWDGVWVFIKYQNNIDNLWKHAKVSNSSGDHSIDGGVLEINPSSDSLGVFIRRSAPGAGNISATNVALKLGPLVGSGDFNFRIFGTEVVYIPQASFQLGDGNPPSSGYFTAQTIDATKQGSGIALGGLYTSSPALPAAFPMGYNAYYLMKYEITNEQWVDFLNTLTYDQQANRIDVAPNTTTLNSQAYAASANTMADNVIKIQTPGSNNTSPAVFGCDLDNDNNYNESNDGQNIPVSIIGKGDLFAYLDWSGLRIMTEMEFEKACRGTQNRVLNECAWGSATINAKTRTSLSNGGTSTEVFNGVAVDGLCVANGNINAAFGPFRSGAFATSTSGRASSGAGFYGNMELSGNVWELCVAVDAAGIAFTGNHGDGTLTTAGQADVSGWPSGSTGGATFGTSQRGSSWLEQTGYTTYLSVSYRGLFAAAARATNYGGRGCRTAP
jgi:formylglycine-generating enzyme required for sulfatase activity